MSTNQHISPAGVPQVLLKSLEACDSGTGEHRQLAAVCMLDAGLSLAVLRAAAVTRPAGRRSGGVRNAVRRLGIAALRQLLVSMLVRQCSLPVQKEAQERLLDIWRHSLRCAFIARRLAQATEAAVPEEAYLAGLMHDVGKLALIGSRQPVAKPRRHAGIGALMVEQATGDSLLADAVRYHHEGLERVCGAFAMVRIVHLANRLAHRLQGVTAADEKLAGRLCGVSSGLLGRILQAAADDFREALRFLGVGSRAGQEGDRDFAAGHDRQLLRCRREIDDRSMLSAGLQSLMDADPLTGDILRSLADGLKIHFDLNRLMFFLPNEDGTRLIPAAVKGCSGPPQGAAVALEKTARGILTKCFAKGRVTDSYGLHGPSLPTIADEQIMHLLGSEGVCCVPLQSGDRCLGVVVLGADPETVRSLRDKAGLLTKLTRSAARFLAVRRDAAGRGSASVAGPAERVSRTMLHEINNPLGIIKNYLRLLSRKLPTDHEGRRDLEVILEEIDRIGLILKKNACNIPSETPIRRSIDLNRHLAGFMKMLEKSLLQPRNIRLQMSMDPSLPPVNTDWNALKQVLLNLVKNAAEAMPGGGRLRLGTRRVPAVGGEASRDRFSGVEITVADTGPGIDPAVARRLLEPHVTTKGEGHAGLGLYAVRVLVRALGGRLQFGSRPQKGTVFRILLPV